MSSEGRRGDGPRVERVGSRDNAGYKSLKRLVQDNAAYRRQQRLWLEGDHLCRAALQRGRAPLEAVFSESEWNAAGHAWRDLPALNGVRLTVLDDALWSSLSALESPARMGFVLELPAAPALDPQAPTVVLDRVQDAGNVGSILRSASAFGFAQVLALSGTAALWSPKVLRAGMGAHFALRLIEGADASAVDALRVPLLATSSHGGERLGSIALPWPCAWLLGHEGQGVAAELLGRASQRVRIAQPGGEESLNVAASAAICLHASASAASPDPGHA